MGTITEAGSVSQVTGWKDILMRAFKTALAMFLTALPVDALASFDVGAAKLALFAALSAGGTIILNAILAWTQTP